MTWVSFIHLLQRRSFRRPMELPVVNEDPRKVGFQFKTILASYITTHFLQRLGNCSLTVRMEQGLSTTTFRLNDCWLPRVLIPFHLLLYCNRITDSFCSLDVRVKWPSDQTPWSHTCATSFPQLLILTADQIVSFLDKKADGIVQQLHIL